MSRNCRLRILPAALSKLIDLNYGSNGITWRTHLFGTASMIITPPRKCLWRAVFLAINPMTSFSNACLSAALWSFVGCACTTHALSKYNHKSPLAFEHSLNSNPRILVDHLPWDFRSFPIVVYTNYSSISN
jgi:hypothetical protein